MPWVDYAAKRARRNRRIYNPKSGVRALAGGATIAEGNVAGTRESVMRAAAVVRDAAIANSRSVARSIGLATYVAGVSEQRAMVITDGALAPMAAPFEFGERHPLWGNDKFWYPQPRKPYLKKAATSKRVVNAAVDIYGETEKDLLAAEYGYDGGQE